LDKIVEESLNGEQQNTTYQPPVTYQQPCLVIYVCAYPSLDCFENSFNRKKCYIGR